MGNRRHVRDRRDTDTQGAQRAHRRFTTRTWALDLDIKILDALLNGSTTRDFGCNLCSERRGLARTLETLTTRRRPGQGIALAIGDRDDGVVERSMHVRDTVETFLRTFLRTRCAALLAGDFAMLIFQSFTSSAPQHPCAAPCGYEHSCAYADHAWADRDDGGSRGSSQCPSSA